MGNQGYFVQNRGNVRQNLTMTQNHGAGHFLELDFNGLGEKTKVRILQSILGQFESERRPSESESSLLV